MALAAFIVVMLTSTASCAVWNGRANRGFEPEKATVQTIDLATFTITVSPAKASPGEEVTVFVNVSSDVPGSTISVRIYYDAYNLPFVNNTASPQTFNTSSNPARIVQKYTYEQPGNFTDLSGLRYFWIKAYAQDDSSGTVSKRIQYRVNYNSPPVFIQTPPNPLWVNKNETKNLTIMVRDLDNDTLTVDWDFGDGTTARNVISNTLEYAYANQTHAWNPIVPPSDMESFVNYTLNVSISDGNGHYLNDSSAVNIFIPRNWGPELSMTSSKTYFDPSETITFYASVRDLEGDPIWWYFDFDDGSTLSSYTTRSTPNSTVWNNVSHQFGPGIWNYTSYNVTLHIVDEVPAHNYSISVEVRVVINHPPVATLNISRSPELLEIDSAVGYLNVSFMIEVFDFDGDVITATWSMNDGTPDRINVSAGGVIVYSFTQWRNFTEGCHFNISVVITDGMEGHTITRWLNSTMSSTNMPPVLTLAPTWVYRYGSEGRPGEMLNITMNVTDPEFDPLNITWDFGDGSPILHFNYSFSDYHDGNVTVNVSHAYSTVKDFVIHIRITDNKIGHGNHVVEVNATVTVSLPFPSLAEAGDDELIIAGGDVVFNGTINEWAAYYNYTWNFTYDGDNVVLYGVSPTFVFQIPGTYVVTLRMYDGLHTTTDTMTVTALANPVPELSSPSLVLVSAMILGALITFLFRRTRPED